jgi:hypothetical protein
MNIETRLTKDLGGTDIASLSVFGASHADTGEEIFPWMELFLVLAIVHSTRIWGVARTMDQKFTLFIKQRVTSGEFRQYKHSSDWNTESELTQQIHPFKL